MNVLSSLVGDCHLLVLPLSLISPFPFSIVMMIVWMMMQSAKLFVGDALAFDERRTTRPYKWAQHLAGIDFLPDVSPLLTSHENSNGETAKSDAVISGLSLYRQQNRVQTVVQRIRSRKKAQLALV
jgi:THO complex subunit 5